MPNGSAVIQFLAVLAVDSAVEQLIESFIC